MHSQSDISTETSIQNQIPCVNKISKKIKKLKLISQNSKIENSYNN